MTIEDKNIIWLDLFYFLGYQKKVKILSLFNSNQDIRKFFMQKPELKEILTAEEFAKMSSMLEEHILENKLQKYVNDGIQMITLHNPNYPQLLKEIDTPPLCLYCKGNLQLLNSVCVGVVGTRKPTDYGNIITKQFAKELASCGITIVSGLAVGVDSIAHRAALEENGATIAVLAGGLYHIYPTLNISLARTIAENNLLVSEVNPEIVAQTFNFPIRNRIVAGLSRAVLVTQAGEKSGSLITTNYAIDYNREIFAIPGNINSPMSAGTNNLINEFSTCFTTTPDKILEFLQINKEKQKNPSVQLDFQEQIIINYILAEKKSFQQILEHTKLKPNELNTILLKLEMEGLITKLANNSYIKS